MSSWVVLVIGFAIVSALILVARRWGAVAIERKTLEKTIEAARTRKAIDNEVAKLSPSELADRLRRGSL